MIRLANLPFKFDPLNANIVIEVSAPCDSPDAFAGPEGGPLFYYMTNSSRECCPVNRWEGGAGW